MPRRNGLLVKRPRDRAERAALAVTWLTSKLADAVEGLLLAL